MINKVVYSFLLLSFFTSCNSSTPESEENLSENTEEEVVVADDFPSRVERAHEKNKFLSHDAVQFDFHLIFRGEDRIKGSMTLSTNSYQGILDKGNDEQIIFEGDKVFYSPSISDSSKVRFDAYTWSYFFLFPFKLNDGGTVWNDYENDSLNGDLYEVEKLSFDAGTGDAPDDWYVTYANTETSLVYAAAYIVTYTKDQATAEENPHAIVYKDYENVDGVPLSHSWEFRGWQSDTGLTDHIGSATLSNFKFMSAEEVDFSIPKDYIEIK